MTAGCHELAISFLHVVTRSSHLAVTSPAALAGPALRMRAGGEQPAKFLLWLILSDRASVMFALSQKKNAVVLDPAWVSGSV